MILVGRERAPVDRSTFSLGRMTLEKLDTYKSPGLKKWMSFFSFFSLLAKQVEIILYITLISAIRN